MKGELSEDEARTPSGMEGIAEGIRNLVAEGNARPEEKKEASAESEEEPCETCDEKTEVAKEGPKARLFIVDKETGQEIPAVFKSEGKEYIPEAADKLLTWAGMGIHANRRLEEVKDLKGFVDVLRKAQAEGRLIIKDESEGPSGKEKEASDEPEDETLTDPAIISLRKDLKSSREEVQELKKTIDALKGFVLSSKSAEVKKEIENEIEKNAGKYPLGKRRSKEVWKLLAETNDEGPVYTVEEAMRKVHEDSLAEFKDYLKEHPELVEKDKISKEAVAQYLSEKEENEKHPVSSPSGSPTPSGAGKTEEIKSMADAVAKMKEVFASSKGAGGKA